MLENLDNKKDILKNNFIRYRKILKYMEADVPIQCLCLPKIIENKLIGAGCLRVYDVFDLDFSKIKGLGISRQAIISSSLDQFLSM